MCLFCRYIILSVVCIVMELFRVMGIVFYGVKVFNDR